MPVRNGKASHAPELGIRGILQLCRMARNKLIQRAGLRFICFRKALQLL